MKGASRGSPRNLPAVVERIVPIGTRLRFIVPLPPQALSPNRDRTVHWAERNGAIQEYKSAVRLLAIDARNRGRWPGPAPKVTVSLVFMTKRDITDAGYRPLDVGNAVSAFKAGFDGLVLAGLFPDDNHHVMSLGSVEIDTASGPGVQITVEAI